MIRPASPADVPGIYQLIRDLADYERALPEVTGTQEQLFRSLFGPDPAVFAHVAEHEGTVVGFALWFLNYSTWLCQHGIYLEDLYVTPGLRGQGTAGRCSPSSRRCACSAATAGWSGGCWTGTHPPAGSTRRSAPGPWTSGPCTG